MARKYLDSDGLGTLWGKIKGYFLRRNFIPEQEKTFTGVIASSNNDPKGYLYFGKIIPDNFYVPYKIRYKMIIDIGGLSSSVVSQSQFEVEIRGLNNTYYGYKIDNTVHTSYRSIYGHLFYPCTATGIANGYGHLLGIRLQSAYNPTTAANARTVKIEILETENCDFTFFDSMLLYANVSGTGSTNYYTRYGLDGTSNGYKIYGDSNDPNYYNRNYYGLRTTYTALYRYQLCLSRNDNTFLPINTVNNSTATNKALTTETFDPFGDIVYWPSTTTYNAGANVGDGWYSQYLADFRYSFNIGGYDVTSTLEARKPLYLVAALQSDGSAKLNSQPLSQVLPSTEDGLLYIYLGQVYPDTKPYRVYLTIKHPVYMYKNGGVREISSYAEYAGNAAKVNNHTVGSDVPSDAKFTDTVTTATTTGDGNAVTSITASNGALTVTKGTTFLTQHQDISGKVDKTGDTMTGQLTVPILKTGYTVTNVANYVYGGTAKETVIYTGIKYVSSAHMPVVRLKGYCYGLGQTTEICIGLYIYQNEFYSSRTATNLGAWKPDIYLFTYEKNSVTYVAIGLSGQIYYNMFSVDVQDEKGKFDNIDIDGWDIIGYTSTGQIPDIGTDHCVSVQYKSDIQNPPKVNNHTVNSDVPADAKFTDTTDLTQMTGTLGTSHGGTGKTSGKDAANYFMNALDTGSSTPADADYYISQYVNGGTTTTTYHRRPMSALWAYIKSKIDNNGGYTNKSEFGKVKIGSTLVEADTVQDTLELAAGSNITLTPDATNDKITIAATDTTYESKAAAEDGTALSLVTTGEKYLWNSAASGTGSASWSNISGKPTETGESTTGISIGNHATGTVIGVQSSTTSVTGVQSSTTTASKVTLGTALSIPNVTGASDVTVPKAATSTTTVPIKNATATSIPNVTDVGSASNWVFENITVPIKASSATTVPIAASSATTVPIKDASATTIPNVTDAGSGSASLTFTMDSTDTKKLVISFSHTHTPPTIGTPISVTGVQSTTTSVTGINGSTSVTGVQSSTTTASHVKSGGNGTAPTLGTAISIYGVQSSTTSVTGVSGSTTASKVTLGTAIDVPNVTNVSDVTVPIKATSATTVPIKNTSASTFVTGTTHTITDNGHTHSIS